jgi:putative hydrolase of the HAD superfamily
MLDAVLFDWGETLVHWEWSLETLELGHTAGLRAIGREPVPDLAARFAETYLPLFDAPGVLEEIGYAGIVRRLLEEAGIDADDAQVDRFVGAEHEAWFPQHQLDSTTHALLEALRGRGLKLGVVSNAFEAGVRKPQPAIFQRALGELGVAPERTLFVGDSLAADLGGAKALGMRTCQSLWFRADDDPAAPEPDFHAFTQMDVLTAVKRLMEAG